MASELIAHSAFGLMDYWLRAAKGSFQVVYVVRVLSILRGISATGLVQTFW